MQTNTIHILYS